MSEGSARPIILWREPHRHCQGLRTRTAWTLQLYVDDILVREAIVGGGAALVCLAEHWREVVDPTASTPPTIETIPQADRRRGVADRRVIRRGGRRGTEPLR